MAQADGETRTVIVTAGADSRESALGALRELKPRGGPVAVFLADHRMPRTNAAAAVDDAGGEGTPTVRTALHHDRLPVEFRGTGSGIAPEIRERVPDPFLTTKPVREGTGLGHDSSWRIVVDHHRGGLQAGCLPGGTRSQVLPPLTATESDPTEEPV